ncbi:MAG: outer membrane beta-barrel protein [Telluria sp.]
MNKLFCGAMLLAATLAAPAVHADDTFYVGAGISKHGRLYLNGQIQNNHPNPYSVFAGYGLTDKFAIEAGYAAFGNYKFSGPASIDISALYVAAKGSIKLGENWSLYGKAGVARLTLDVSGDPSSDVHKVRPLLGVGFDYRITKDIALGLEYNDYRSFSTGPGRITTRQVQATVKYNF